MRIVVGMTGASGAPLGVAVLKALHRMPDIETHLVISKWARATIGLETNLTMQEVAALADVVYQPGDQAAPISSGSFHTDGMIVVPCSMKTLAGIRTGYADGLLARAADVILKEGRRLVLVPRESPLSEIHLDNMLTLSRMGVRIVPPMPAFYNDPHTIDDIIDHIVSRVLDQFGLRSDKAKPWTGLPAARRNTVDAAPVCHDEFLPDGFVPAP
ncbi:non-oxidative hydroxyarylic acid decarboxylases subunit B [Nocardia sp. NPDC050175]|uniref:non-oxidative hydroxyarylic acid decarboxylases subunit B n=1 Tax=Nocardia sp. NPDC050175 TaxID=3364317 RepID=UPI0037874C86